MTKHSNYVLSRAAVLAMNDLTSMSFPAIGETRSVAEYCGAPNCQLLLFNQLTLLVDVRSCRGNMLESNLITRALPRDCHSKAKSALLRNDM